MLDNLIKISDLTKDDINEIVNLAKAFKQNKKLDNVAKKYVALMFFENSTRTKVSFDIAAKKLGFGVTNFDVQTSSINKGESLKDTLENLYFIGINAAVIRHSEDDIIERTLNELAYPIKLINAGSGCSSHPTQALLDYFTMLEKLGNVANKKITIVGDIAHSRVANSNIALLKKFNANVTVCSPEYFKPDKDLGVKFEPDLKRAIKNADCVMMLRIQKERIKAFFDENDYIKNYGLTTEIFQKYSPNAILMHPGPVNRGIEISSELLDSEIGKTILKQAQNGVFIRMAVYYLVLGGGL